MELSLLVTLNASAETPLHRQLYRQVRDAILTGQLNPHTCLPASRQLAKTLGVSRTTVVQSYDQLISEGYLQTKPGAGTFVCSQIPDGLLSAGRSLVDLPSAELSDTDSATPQIDGRSNARKRLSSYGARLATAADYEPGVDCPLSFRYGLPDLSLFPVGQWRRLLNRQANKSDGWMRYDGEPMGHECLRQEIAQYIRDVRAVRCSPDQVLITSGTQQALSLIGQVLMNAGEAIAFENPGYLSAKRIFSARDAAIVPVPVDDLGIRVNEPGGLVEISATRPTPRLAYVTPSHQFPTGGLMSLSRRLALLDWARRNEALIIEDDYDSEFRYSGSPIPALQGLDEHGCVLYVGTFSKVMFPGLRLGYIVLPPSWVDVFRRAKWLCDRQCSLIDQAALAEFIGSGGLAQHIRRMRTIYDRRRRSLVESLQQIMPDVLIPGDASGLHILARMPQGNAASWQQNDEWTHSLIRQAEKLGVGLFSAGPHYCSAYGASLDSADDFVGGELIFGFGNISEIDIKRAIAKIQPLLQS